MVGQPLSLPPELARDAVHHLVQRGYELPVRGAGHDGLTAVDVNDHFHHPFDSLLEEDDLGGGRLGRIASKAGHPLFGPPAHVLGNLALSFRDLDAQTDLDVATWKDTEKS